MKNQMNRGRLRKAIKAFMASYKLEPIKAGPVDFGGEYLKTLKMFSDGDQLLELQTRRQELEHLVRLFQEMYPDQLHRSKVSDEIHGICEKWIEEGHKVDSDSAIDQATDAAISAIEASIKPFRIVVPLSGLVFDSTEPLDLAGAKLIRNHADSDVQVALEGIKEKVGQDDLYKVFSEAPAYLECEIEAQQKRAIEKAVEMAQSAIDILHLYIGSFYFRKYRDQSFDQEINIGRLAVPSEETDVLIFDSSKPTRGQLGGASFSRKIFVDFEVNRNVIGMMVDCELEKVNSLLAEASSKEKVHVSRRLLRAVNWFSKGTRAQSIADAFLMFCISIESMLSEGRTAQDAYAAWLASLICREEDVNLHPIGGYLSSEFARHLRNSSTLSERFNVVLARCKKLFDYRNNIAHGNLLDEEIKAHFLLEIETIARNAIFAFVQGGWETLPDFRQWYEKSTWLHFDPSKDNPFVC